MTHTQKVVQTLRVCALCTLLAPALRAQDAHKPVAPAKPVATPAVTPAAAAAATQAAEQATTAKASAGTLAPDASPAASAAPSATAASAVDKSGMPTSVTIAREVFDYAGNGRRDPYKSLMSSSQVRPLLSDLHLTAIAFDPDGRNSVAILRDNVTKEQHRVRVGQQLGRLRVANITAKTVVFSIEEFGFNRQETLQVRSDTTKARTP